MLYHIVAFETESQRNYLTSWKPAWVMDNIQLLVFLPLPSQEWGYRHELPCPFINTEHSPRFRILYHI